MQIERLGHDLHGLYRLQGRVRFGQALDQGMAGLPACFQVAQAILAALWSILVIDVGDGAEGVLHGADLDVDLFPVPRHDLCALRWHGIGWYGDVDHGGQQQFALALVVAGGGACDPGEFLGHARSHFGKIAGI